MKQSPLIELYPSTTVFGDIGDATVARSFTSSTVEHVAIRTSSALLDLSGNGGISVTGPGATSLIQTAMARDVEYLFPERCLTTLVLSSDGAIVDLATVYRQVDGFLLESSVGRASALLAQLESLEMEDEVTIAPLLDAVFLGIEGPTAWEWIGKTIGVEATGLPFQGVTTATVAGAPALVARSGVTGEFGYKVCLALDAAKALWSQLAVEVTPTGYDALEIAMLEVRQPNVHAEVVEGADAITCGFNWVAEPTKASFVGRDALLEQFESNTIRTIGFEVEEPSSEDLPPGAPVKLGAVPIGTVLLAHRVPGSGRLLGLARVPSELAVSGLPIEVGASAGARTISSPYTIPTSWSVSIV